MSKVLNKKALAEVLATKCDMTKKAALEVVDVLLDEVVCTLQEGGKVDLSGFGKFETKVRAARTGINPKTKEAIKIPETKVPGFKAAKALKDAIK
ncbi:MAG: HU family DNA-binding protein [Erysipelotrichaceae bacterium]|nr:HU family DNA-binding protein [Erysipelotrichaceae bacterium]MDD3923489.1 HU family DNA-binding protein [Erysipelotrichaceae bacterium]MDD4643325.1 HU family DNA-binding protein [Erysipelotrichaceae bacterium]